MYLSNLDIVGFKSFAQKTNFKFSEGISGLVGPNGCGKTNIVDAIRWVLGEQKSAVLRSEVMDNVIFNGTANRKPVGMAEVALTLQNNKNVLPTEYNEVTITRRLFRNGDSQYLINNNQCRLKDIIDLFMDTGMGSDSYSVIELKMVEDILNGRAEERRHLLEEAAGITKYKQRRKEAGRKLILIQNDLVRVNDIVSEIEKQVATLARQATKTRRHNKLNTQLREIETALLFHDYHSHKIVLFKLDSELNELHNTKSDIEKEITQSEESLTELEQNFINADNLFKIAIEKETGINSVISNQSREIAVCDEKISSITKNNERISKEINESINLNEKIVISISEINDKLKDLADIKSSNFIEFNDKKILRDEASSNILSLREDLNTSNEEVINLQNGINGINNSKKRSEARKSNIDLRIDDGENELDKIRFSISEIDENISKTILEKDVLIENLRIEQLNFNDASSLQTELQLKIQVLQNEISESRLILTSKKASLEFLSSLVETDDSSKFLISSKNWLPDNEKQTLAELIGADDEHRTAIEVALGNYAKILVTNTKEDAYSAFTLLKSSEKGKATFLCKNLIKEIKAPDEIKAENGAIGWISEIVRVEDNIRYALRNLLSGTLLVDTFENAEKIVSSGQALSAVTLAGEIVKKGGFVRGGSEIKKEGLSVGKKERIQKFTKEINVLESEISKRNEELTITKEKLNGINLNHLNQLVKKAENDLRNNEQTIVQLKLKIDSLNSNYKIIELNLAQFHEELAGLNTEDNQFEIELGTLQSQLNISRENYQANLSELQKAEMDFTVLQDSAKNAEMQMVKIESDIENLTKENTRLQIQLGNLELKIKDLKIELDLNVNELDNLSLKKEQLAENLEEVKISAREIQAEREYLSEQKLGLDEQLKQYTNDLNQKRKVFDRAVEMLHQHDLKTNEYRSENKSVLNKALEYYNIDLETLEYIPNEEFSPDSAKDELIDIKNKLTQLGSVNFLAIEEYEEQNNRLIFYQQQVNDLIESEKTLKETITEINKTAEELFLKTFDQVHTNFTGLFHTLFGEQGEAELKLAEGNPLECDIEIIAKPPGKKPHSIDMLSGGEKTLTAIALLFAIYMVKPSPFCILDEVDAPLDDANIDRFLNMIREFSKNTQFLVVTHNKRTMEAADTMYGITMQEEGVSKVVSVRFAKEAG